jgi:hypothetical protein
MSLLFFKKKVKLFYLNVNVLFALNYIEKLFSQKFNSV